MQHVELGADLGPEWWHRFGSPALDDIVARALAHNRTLDAAAATLAQAEGLVAAQAGTLAPQVGATAGAGRQKYGEQFLGPLPKPPPFGYFAVGATVSYTLDYTGGALVRSSSSGRSPTCSGNGSKQRAWRWPATQ